MQWERGKVCCVWREHLLLLIFILSLKLFANNTCIYLFLCHLPVPLSEPWLQSLFQLLFVVSRMLSWAQLQADREGDKPSVPLQVHRISILTTEITTFNYNFHIFTNLAELINQMYYLTKHLPLNIRQSPSIDSVKYHLKHYLLQNNYVLSCITLYVPCTLLLFLLDFFTTPSVLCSWQYPVCCP